MPQASASSPVRIHASTTSAPAASASSATTAARAFVPWPKLLADDVEPVGLERAEEVRARRSLPVTKTPSRRAGQRLARPRRVAPRAAGWPPLPAGSRRAPVTASASLPRKPRRRCPAELRDAGRAAGASPSASRCGRSMSLDRHRRSGPALEHAEELARRGRGCSAPSSRSGDGAGRGTRARAAARSGRATRSAVKSRTVLSESWREKQEVDARTPLEQARENGPHRGVDPRPEDRVGALRDGDRPLQDDLAAVMGTDPLRRSGWSPAAAISSRGTSAPR